MELSRLEKGLKKLSEVDGTAGENVIEALNDIAPDVGKYIIEFAFGDIYCRESLNLQEREMITVSSLLTLGGCENQLEVHINGALNVGVIPKKIIEIFIQCIPYTGFPRVLNAVGVAKRVFKLRNISIENVTV
jgi:4-carboxymuconolactone decarboxylase